jgi:hypothetical protein
MYYQLIQLEKRVYGGQDTAGLMRFFWDLAHTATDDPKRKEYN